MNFMLDFLQNFLQGRPLGELLQNDCYTSQNFPRSRRVLQLGWFLQVHPFPRGRKHDMRSIEE